VSDATGTGLIGLPEAAELLGVHYMTVYRYVRTGRLPAISSGGVWKVDPADVRSFRNQGSNEPRARGGSRQDAAANFERCLLEGDEAGAFKVCDDALASWATPIVLYSEIVIPSMHDIGMRWQTGELSVADEHRAAATVIRVMGRLGPLFLHRGRRRGTVVIGAPSGDRHSIPVMMVADLLRDAGFTVVDLGADTPAQSFVDAARRADRLVAVAIGATLTDNEAAVSAAVVALHDALPDLEVIAGGSGLATSAAAARVGANRWSGADWQAVVRAADESERAAQRRDSK
jgi:excisionase family DNA binding protein